MTALFPTPPAMGAESSSSNALKILAALLEQRTGQLIATNREWRAETALKPILRERGLDTLDQLAAATIAGGDPALCDQVVDALLNQESSFFRDGTVFETIANVVADRRAASPEQPVRIWSAGCSTGQEPLSLAILLAEQLHTADARLPDIVATDVSDAAILRARTGAFTQFEIQRGLPVRRMVRWFDPSGDNWVAKPELVRQVAFRRLNLIDDPLPPGKFDVVLCRNVLLYLSPVLRRQVLERIASVLRPDGLLALGAGETVIGQTDAFRPSQTYRGLYELSPPA